MRNGGDVAKAIACGADAVMIGSPLARAYEAPGHGFHWGMATFHPTLPRGARVRTTQNGSLQEIITGPARENDGTFNLMGALRTSMATCGYRDIAEFNRAELMVAPALQSEGKQLQRDQAVGMGAARRGDGPGGDGVERGGPRHDGRRPAGRGARARARARRGRGRRPRLRRPVLAADRAAGARARGVLRAAAAPRRRRGGAQAPPEGADPVGRPRVGVRRGRAAARPGAARARDPRARHLLRDAGDRADARRARRGRRGGRVRPLAADGERRRAGCWPARRPSSRAGCRTATRCSSRRRASRRWRRRRESPVAALEDVERGIYGIQFHPEVVHTPYGQQILTTFLEDICGCERTWSAASIIEEQIAAIRAQVGDGKVDLRALGRRRLLGGGAARAPRDRRPAHVRVRRPRADAQERGRAGHLRVPRPLQGAARRRRRRGPLPRAAGRAQRSRGQAQGDRGRVHPRLRGGGGASSATPATSCRGRCTPT